MLQRPVLAALLAVTLVACAPSEGDTSAADDVQQQLGAQQRALESAALAGLRDRSCAPPEGSVRLKGLPSVRLACLGRGPAADVSRGDARPTVVNLWASWCAPCVREMPLLQRAHVRAGAAVRFVGVDVQDEPASAAGLLEATGVQYDQYADPDGEVRSGLRAVGLPVTLVYAADGREVARRFGEVKGSWLDDALRKAGVVLAGAAS